MTFDPLTRGQFESFHQQFNGDIPVTFSICRECGGPCEYTKLASLLPGEAEFMASKRNEPIEKFRLQHLDGVLIDGQIIDILKCARRCTFLNKTTFKCEIRDYKPVICLMYPLYFPHQSTDGLVFLDTSCKIASNEETSSYFNNHGRVLVEQLGIPEEWIRRVRFIDQYDYNYSELIAGRRCGFDEYYVYEIDTIASCRL